MECSGEAEAQNTVSTPSRKTCSKVSSSTPASAGSPSSRNAGSKRKGPPSDDDDCAHAMRETPSETTPTRQANAGEDVTCTVKSLKACLAEHRIDSSICVEKSDLQALWNRFETLRSKPME